MHAHTSVTPSNSHSTKTVNHPMTISPPLLQVRQQGAPSQVTFPTFSTNVATTSNTSALSVLASVATGELSKQETSTPEIPQSLDLHTKGQFNPVSLLPPRTAKKILDLEFVEISDISLDNPPPTGPGQPPLPPKQPIQDISCLVEKFLLMAAVITSRFPEKVPELFSYQGSAERNFDDRRRVSYNRCYCWEALTNKDLNWSVPNLRLYNEAFTGHARSIPQCSHCLQEDHTSWGCPRNPTRQWYPWPPQDTMALLNPTRQPRQQSSECCRHSATTCRYLHKCLECWGPHPQNQCSRTGQAAYNRPRSPLNQSIQPPPAPPQCF